MLPPTHSRRLMIVALSAMTLTLALPHYHDTSTVSHHAQSCRVCKMQETYRAVPCGTMVAVGLLPVRSELLQHPSLSPHQFLIVRHAFPRAPPVLS